MVTNDQTVKSLRQRVTSRAGDRGTAQRRKKARVAVVALVLLILAPTVAACSGAVKQHATMDLRSLMITDAQAGVNGIQFLRRSGGPLDVAEVSYSKLANQQRMGDQILQGWDTYFVSADHRIELHVRLVEMTNHFWADTIRSKANAATPEGFPPSTRMLLLGDGSGRVGVNLVKGRVQAIILVRPLDNAALDEMTVNTVLKHAAGVQIDRIPDVPDLTSDTRIDTSDLRAWLIGMQIVAVPVVAAVLALAATLCDIGTLERLFPARSRSRRVTFYDLTPDVRRARRVASRRVGVQMLLATAFGVLALVLQLVVKGSALLHLAFVPLCFAVAIALDVVLRSREPEEIPGVSNGRLPLIVGTIGAMAVMYGSAFMVLAGIAIGVLFNGAITIKVVLVVICVMLGMRALKYSALPLRYAKRFVQPDVRQALQLDPRQEVLLLRSFQDDTLTMRMHRSARHSAIELASAETFERFEELLAWSLWRFGPVFAFGQPETQGQLQPLGAAREFYDDSTWEEAVRLRMKRSSMLVYVVGRSQSLYTEFIKAQQLNVVSKCLFVFPPVDFTELRARLTVFEAAFSLPPGALPPIDSRGRRLIGAYIGDDGYLVAVGVNGRDDLAYQTVFTVAAAMLIPRDQQLRSASGPGPIVPDANVSANMVKFDPRRDYSSKPTVWWGLTYLLLMARRRRAIEWQD
ncbi:hypothetical protein FHT44_006327 [Mycolicibacterium sp. BK634]|uniref:hypothetical protein n=1 Tax=Mycolicibacterium sp. BK634 TaxID=2587099 RepID=UPI001620DFD3|nr:hypothetical protein [Mycolicibacterium sp. BK634]MBB3753805.1 hypothetical protein [Mycolicibacterium sp. BK634]